MSYNNRALFVIDAQQSFRHRPYFKEKQAQPYFQAQQALIDSAKVQGFAIVQILHIDDDIEFTRHSGLARTIDGINIAPDIIIEKSRHSAFVGTGLDVWLRQQSINQLIISGIRTEQCCETSARHASDLGYTVDYVTEATLTFPMTHADGTEFSVEDIKKRTELVLAGRFARISSVTDITGITAKGI